MNHVEIPTVKMWTRTSPDFSLVEDVVIKADGTIDLPATWPSKGVVDIDGEMFRYKVTAGKITLTPY